MFVVIWNKYQSINIYCAEYVFFFFNKIISIIWNEWNCRERVCDLDTNGVGEFQFDLYLNNHYIILYHEGTWDYYIYPDWREFATQHL